MLTASRSRVSFHRFAREFRDCIDDSFRKYYLVGRIQGKVTAVQFRRFCEQMGASCEPAPYEIQRMVNPALIEGCFSVVEYAFDARKLRETMKQRARAAGVRLELSTEVQGVRERNGALCVSWKAAKSAAATEGDFDVVLNASYSCINRINAGSLLEVIPLKHQIAELALVEMPEELSSVGITVMCGPFFSFMPFPDRKLHSFSHVRYTPHREWSDTRGTECLDAREVLRAYPRQSAWGHMVKDAARYIPLLAQCRYRDSLWEVKTVLPRSETDDSRPILFRENHGMRGYHCILGGKMDNVYDVRDAMKGIGL
jgi:hypothetical protein